MILTLLMVILIIFLTFQSKHATTSLADAAVSFLKNLGIQIERKPLRHYVHYIEYFALGFLISVTCLVFEVRLSVGLLVGCSIALVEEGLKTWLPTREFDLLDLMRDFVGLGLAMFMIWIFKKAFTKGR